MSMTELQSDVEEGSGLTAQEQAQFDAMRTGSDMPADPPAHVDPVLPDPSAKPDKVDPPEDHDPDVETIKDATGKDVLDATTGKPQKRVSFHKFQRTEKLLKEAEERARISEEKQARIDERLKIINEALATPGPDQQQEQQAEEDPEPDPETQIFEHNKWLRRQLTKTNDRLNSFQDQQSTREQEVEINNIYRSSAAQFASTEPAFAAAYVYLIKQREGELIEAGVKDKKLRDAQIVREERGLVKGAIDDSANPAQRIFNIAVMRGFNKEAALAEMAKQKGANGAAPAAAAPAADARRLDAPAAAAAAAAPAPAKPDVKAEIEAIKAGSAAAMTLSGSGGAAPSQLTPQILADMPQEEFDEMVAKLSKKQLRELLGD